MTYASKLARWGVETSILVQGAFTDATNHPVYSDQARFAEYNEGPYASVPEQALEGLVVLEQTDVNVGEVANANVEIIGVPFGTLPFQRHIDPSKDRAGNAQLRRARSVCPIECSVRLCNRAR